MSFFHQNFSSPPYSNLTAVRCLAIIGTEGLWADLFRAARSESDSDLVPYWVFPVEEGAKIERHVPFLPLSTDSDRAERLRQSLAVYRLVFGQSRQEDLVSFLLHHVPQDRVDEVARSICIDLSPEPSKNRAESGEDLAPNSLPTQELPGVVVST